MAIIENINLYGICYGGGKYVAVGFSSSSGVNVAYSTDGINWETARIETFSKFNDVITKMAAEISGATDEITAAVDCMFSKKLKESFGIEYWANRNPYSIDGLIIKDAPTTVEIETEIAQFLY